MFYHSKFTKSFILATYLLLSGFFQANAQNPVDSLKTELKKNIHDTVKLVVMGEIMANTLSDQPDHRYYIDEVKKLADKNLASKKISAREKLIWKGAVGQYYNNLSMIYSRSNTIYSIQLIDKAVKIFEEIGDYNHLGIALVGKGIAYKQILNLEESIKCYFLALKAFEKEKKELRDEGGVMYALGSIANAYRQQEDNEKAIVYYKKVLEYYASQKNPPAADIFSHEETHHNLGHTYLLMKDYTAAEKHFRKGLELAKSIQDTPGISLILDKIGRVYLKRGQYKEAQAYYEEALKQDQSEVYKSNVYTSLGELYMEQKKYKEAEKYLQKALAIGLQYNSLNIQTHARKFLYKLYKETKEYGKSLEMYEAYTVMMDSAKLQESDNMLKEQQLRYEFENKELKTKAAQQKKLAKIQLENEQKNARKNIVIYVVISIAILLLIVILFLNYYFKQKNITEANKNNELKQKLLLTQMNPHFIFNSVDNIQSLIHNKQDKEAINYLTKFSKLTRQILENSRENYILLSEEIGMLENYLTIQKLLYNNSFNYEIILDEEIDPEFLLVPPMLTQPFIENAIKHGLKNKQEGGMVKIYYRLKGETLSFEVIDNGSGLTDGDGNDKQHKSLSTQITKERLESISVKKSIKIQTVNVTGTDNVIQGVKTHFEIPFVYNH